jgi:lipopolysaccharide/colanic/teichoic acid biosynthesis glycosyltransferase
MDVFTNDYRLAKSPGTQSPTFLKYLLSSMEVLTILLAFQSSYFISYTEKWRFFFSESNLLILFIFILPFWLTILYLLRITGISTRRYKVLSLLYLQASVSIFYLLAVYDLIFRSYPVPKLFMAGILFFGFVYLYFGRILIYKIFKKLGEKGHNHVTAIIIADDSAVTFIDNLLSNKKLGYKVVVIFTESAKVKAMFESNSIILPERFTEIIHDMIEVDFVDEVLYLKEKTDAVKVREIISTCEDLGVTFRLKSAVPKASLSSAVRTDIADGKFLSFVNIPNNTFSLAIKKSTDINIALLMIVVLAPVLIILSLLVKLTSKGPVISTISKSGWRGRQIRVYRFRTMYSNADKRSVIVKSRRRRPGSEFEADPRITRMGRFLLMSGLDQLPQLFNVLKGEMSLIAPQHPLQSESVKSYGRKYS